jgi:hypothetical protein
MPGDEKKASDSKEERSKGVQYQFSGKEGEFQFIVYRCEVGEDEDTKEVYTVIHKDMTNGSYLYKPFLASPQDVVEGAPLEVIEFLSKEENIKGYEVPLAILKWLFTTSENETGAHQHAQQMSCGAANAMEGNVLNNYLSNAKKLFRRMADDCVKNERQDLIPEIFNLIRSLTRVAKNEESDKYEALDTIAFLESCYQTSFEKIKRRNLELYFDDVMNCLTLYSQHFNLHQHQCEEGNIFICDQSNLYSLQQSIELLEALFINRELLSLDAQQLLTFFMHGIPDALLTLNLEQVQPTDEYVATFSAPSSNRFSWFRCCFQLSPEEMAKDALHRQLKNLMDEAREVLSDFLKDFDQQKELDQKILQMRIFCEGSRNVAIVPLCCDASESSSFASTTPRA